MKKRTITLIGYQNDPKNLKNSPESMLRECFLRATRESLNNWGIDNISIERIQGMVNLLEEFDYLNKNL